MLNYSEFLLEYQIFKPECVKDTLDEIIYKFNSISVLFTLITNIDGISVYECSFGIIEKTSYKKTLDDAIILNDGQMFSTMNTIIEIIKEFLSRPNIVIRIIGKSTDDGKNVRQLLYRRYLEKYKNIIISYIIKDSVMFIANFKIAEGFKNKIAPGGILY